MTDYFALLDEARRPWLDGEALKEKFLTRSAAAHPDRVHGSDEATQQEAQRCYTELNTAYLCLRDHRERLRHLLELEVGRKPSDLQEMPPELAEMFMVLSQTCREADGFLARQAGLTSPLLRAQSVAQIENFSQQLITLQTEIKSRQGRLQARLQELDRAWMESPGVAANRSALFTELEVISRWLGFLSRWLGQIQERLLRLML